MHTNIELRQLNPEEWLALKNFWLSAIAESPTAFSSSPQLDILQTDSYWQNKLAETNRYHSYFGAYDSQILIGLCGVVFSKKDKRSHVAKIVRFYVLPEYRNQGIGRRILAHVISKIKESGKISKLELATFSTQIGVISLYKSLGFVEVGTLHKDLKVDNNYSDKVWFEYFY